MLLGNDVQLSILTVEFLGEASTMCPLEQMSGAPCKLLCSHATTVHWGVLHHATVCVCVCWYMCAHVLSPHSVVLREEHGVSLRCVSGCGANWRNCQSLSSILASPLFSQHWPSLEVLKWTLGFEHVSETSSYWYEVLATYLFTPLKLWTACHKLCYVESG